MSISLGIGLGITMQRGNWWDVFSAGGFAATLVMNFKAGQYFNQTQKNLASLVTPSRSTVKSAWMPDGSVGWAGHNLLRESQTFDVSPWVDNGASVASDTVVAPDGTLTADTLTGVSGTLRRYQLAAIPNGPDISIGVYVKQGTSTTIQVDFINISDGPVFTFSTETWSGYGGWTTSYTALPNGWYFLKATRASNKTSAGPGFRVSGVGATVHIWGAHLYQSDLGGMQLNADGTTYYPTTSAAFHAPVIAYDPVNGTQYPSGVELVTNGTLPTDVSGFLATTGTFTHDTGGDGGRGVLTNDGTGTNVARVSQGQTTVVGRTYRLSLGLVKGTAAGATLAVSNLASLGSAYAVSAVTTNGTHVLDFVATATTTYVGASNSVATSGITNYFDNITVQELLVSLPRIAVVSEPAISRLNLYPECKDGTGWADAGSSSTNLTLNALGVFDGVSVAENGGGLESRLYTSAATGMSNASVYPLSFYYRAGTSGKVVLKLRNTAGGTETLITGNVGSVSVTLSDAGSVSGLTETLLGDGITYEAKFYFTENSSNNLQIGIGPYSSTSGQTVIALGAFIGGAGELLPHCPVVGSDGSVVNTAADGMSMGSVPSEVELVTNGTFDTDTDWTKGTGWTIAGGVTNCDGTQTGNTTLQQNGILTVGRSVEVTFTISNYVAGSVRPLAGGSGSGTYRSSNGTHTETIVVSGNSNFTFQADLNFNADIDNVSVQTLVPFVGFDGAKGTWVFKGQWDYSGVTDYILAGDANTRFIFDNTAGRVVAWDGTSEVIKSGVHTDNTDIAVVMSYLEGGAFNILADGSTEATAPLTGDLYAPDVGVGHLNGSGHMHGLIYEILWYPEQLDLATRQGFTA